MRVLITRPIEEGKNTQALLKQRNIKSECFPFLKVTHHSFPFNPCNYDALIFTSRNAVRAFVARQPKREFQVFCVGEQTKELCLDHGFKNVQAAENSTESLQNLLNQQNFKKPAFYARGYNITQTLNHPQIQEAIIYQTEFIEEFDSELDLKNYTHCLFFSVRTARAFVQYCQRNKLKSYLTQIKALCLAPSMVEFLSVLPFRAIEAARTPTQSELLKLLELE